MNVPIDISGIHIETDRLLLRPIQPTDLDDFYAYAKVPGVGEMAGWKHHESIQESQTILDMLVQKGEVLAIVHQADGRMIGTIGLHPAREETLERYPQLRIRVVGYVLSKAYWGQGLMPEAVRALIQYSFQTLKLDALVCCHFAHNSQSRRVIEKSGFRLYAQGKYVSEQLNKTFDDMCYILLRDDIGSVAKTES